MEKLGEPAIRDLIVEVRGPGRQLLSGELHAEHAEEVRHRVLVRRGQRLGGRTVAQLAIAWVNRNPRVSTVILGASKLAQLQDNLGALALTPKLTPEVLERIDAVTKGLAE
jgi:aryl-alcohol dehydrogenase-like predicted oxidoreductase